MNYEWKPEGIDEAEADGVTGEEVHDMLTDNSRPRWQRPGYWGALRCVTVWGTTRSGRPLIAALMLRGGRPALVVGAAEMDQREYEEYLQWERGQHVE